MTRVQNTVANQLYNFQHAGVDHLLSMPFGRPHALLADAPGTGKTMMAIEAAKKAGCKNGIIVCPASVKEQWKRQMTKWELADDDEIQVVYGGKAELDNKPWKVINYDLIRLDFLREQFLKRDWHCLALDEGHRIKSYESLQTEAILHKSKGVAQRCYWKWVLSGTIVPNRPVELYPILKTLAPEVLGPYKDWSSFLNRYCGFQGRGATHVEEITKAIQPFMLRRLLSDVWRDMPAEIEDVQYIHADYEKHPEWLGIGFMPEATERRVIAEAKIPAMARWLIEKKEDGVEKIVCFTFHRAVIEQLSLTMGERYACKLYGGMTPKQRQENFNRFITDPNATYFFIQIGSGGEGLDGLQNVCHNYVKLEPEWSPGRDDQAGDRIMRLGQRHTVFSTQLLVAGSYEERIYNSNQRKRRPINIITKPNGGDYTTMPIEDELSRMNKNIEGLLDVLYAGIQKNAAAAPAAPAAQATFAPPPPVATPAAPSVVAPPPVSAPPVAPPPAVATPSNVAPPAPPAKTPARIQFEADIATKLTPFASEGVTRLQKRLGEYGASHLSEIPEQYFPDFLQTV